MRLKLLNNWTISENQLSIALMKYYVDIIIYAQDDKECILLRVIDSNKKELFFDFDTLEEAITFTEDIIDKSDTYTDIMDIYDDLYYNEKILKKDKRQ